MRKSGKPQKAVPKKPQIKPTRSSNESLETVFGQIQRIMQRHAAPFRTDILCVSSGKKSFQLTVPKPVSVPGAYGGKPVDLPLASLILQKGYVGFYMMCIYADAEARKKISPALLKLLKGKSCFHIKALDGQLEKDIEAALVFGTKTYRDRGWL